jgi:hypothetical protein
MATSFPTELDTLINPQPTDSVQLVSHAEQHSNANDAITALQVKVGTDNSADSTSLDYRLRALETASLDPEEVQDLIAQLLSAGAGITAVYDDELNTFTISVDTSTVATTEFVNQEILTAVSDANQYTDIQISGLSTVYDPLGSAASALLDANEYTDIAVSGLGNSIDQNFVPISAVGNIDGVAQLDENGFVPQEQLNIDERIQDTAALMLTSATHNNITVSYDDETGRISLSALGGGGGGASVTVSANPPLEPSLGDLWLDSDNGRAYAYDGSFWAEIGSGGQLASISATPPGSPTEGSVWVDSDNGKSYIYDGMYWAEI